MDQRMALAKALLGPGMAGQAGDQMQLRPEYQQYAIQAQASGQQPVPFEQWVQAKQQQPQPQQMGRM